jgi:uncharacterized metal-binding protein YceD (DUF177 family)
MQALRQFSIPFKGLKDGIHEYKFEINESFYKAFEEAPLENSDLIVNLRLEKKPDHMLLFFSNHGTIETDCDRCTARINLPLKFENRFIVKFDENEREEDELVYIHPESHHLDVSKLIYDQILLAIPLIKVYACENESPRPCNKKVLDILNKREEKSPDINNPFGEVLKDLKITKSK